MLASLVSSSVVPPTLLLIVFHNSSPSSTHPATPKRNTTRLAPASADATRSLEVPRKRNHHTYSFVFICKYHDQRIFFCCGNFLCRSLMHGVETLARVLNLHTFMVRLSLGNVIPAYCLSRSLLEIVDSKMSYWTLRLKIYYGWSDVGQTSVYNPGGLAAETFVYILSLIML